jgi:hypothetical protein
MTPVAASSHERPSAFNTAPGMLASDASPAHTEMHASGAAAERHSSPYSVRTSGNASAAIANAAGKATSDPSRTVWRYPRRSSSAPSTAPSLRRA